MAKDRRSCLETLIARLEADALFNIFIVDTGSTYTPMLKYLQESRYPVVNVDPLETHAPKFVLWDRDVIKLTGQEEKHFVYTDCDIVPDDCCPRDWLKHLYSLLRKYPQFSKAGLGLKLRDIPDCYAHKDKVLEHEKRFWNNAIEPHVFDSELDTTMALHLPGAAHSYRSIRTGGNYLARHLPWYTDSKNVSEEEQYYIRHLHPKASFWTRRDKIHHEVHNAACGSESSQPQPIEQSGPSSAP